MEYLVLSFIAGILTVLAPCVFPMLPVILGGSLGAKNLWRPFVVIISLVISIITFTLLLKVFAVGIPEKSLKYFSGLIILFFGISLIFPHLWEKFSTKLSLGASSQTMLQKSSQKKGIIGWIFLGISLGPVFSACSPTYFLIVGTVLPQNFWIGFLNLCVYGFGLFLVLFSIALLGQKFTQKLKWASDGGGFFKKFMGVIFIVLALAIMTGYDKKFEGWVLDFEFFQNLSSVESKVKESLEK